MRLILACPCCGNTNFEQEKVKHLIADVNGVFLEQETAHNEKLQFTCDECGLRDYIFNFIIKFTGSLPKGVRKDYE